MSATCPICKTESTKKYGDSPYWVCGNCDCWFQWPQPGKVFIVEFEGDPSFMSVADREVNKQLAKNIFDNVMGGKPGHTLDIGSKLPVLASCLRELGNTAWAMEYEPIQHDLPVLSLQADFEKIEVIKERFDLITLIHTFEHLYDPHAAIRKLKSWLAPGGAVFIRLPDHAVPGFERDLTLGHYQIHPFYYSLKSFLQLLLEEEDQFSVTGTWPMEGAGQRDIVLRPIVRSPIIALGMIVKNEMRDLPRCLHSARPAYDIAYIVDTGSTDGTDKLAHEVYLDASDADGRLVDFSKARNRYLDKIDETDADWVLCLDADDELETPDAIRRASYCPAFNSYAMWIKDGNAKWATHRFWRTKQGMRFHGRCHEYPNLVGASGMLDDGVIRHHGTPGEGQENANSRNLRILMLDWKEHEGPRTAFYVANTHRDGGRWKEAAEWYERRIGMGEHYRDEWLFAHLYLVRCLRQLNEDNRAEWHLSRAISNAKDWCEFLMEYAGIAYGKMDYPTAISYAMRCMGQPIPYTNLWREPSAYTDGPPRLVSWCYEHLGQMKGALQWAKVAKEKIVGEDKEWDDRITRLSHIVMVDPAHA